MNCQSIIFCDKQTPPTAQPNTFSSQMIAIVPAEVADEYKKAKGWSDMQINAPYIVDRTTQTTITLCTSDLFSDTNVEFMGKAYSPIDGKVTITGLKPNTEYTMTTSGKYGDLDLAGELTTKTLNIDINIYYSQRTNLTLTIQGSHYAGDATVMEYGLSGYGISNGEGVKEVLVEGLKPGESHIYTYYVMLSDSTTFNCSQTLYTIPVKVSARASANATQGFLAGEIRDVIDATVINYGFTDYPEQTDVHMTGLDPQQTYTQTFYVTTQEGGKIEQKVTFTTDALTITTNQPKVVSAGNAIVAAQTNIADDETNVGFEWRRTDWTDDFASSTGTAYIYNGTMEGYIRNLNTEKLWKYRPYYLSNTGTYYYGEWVGLDPTNTSYFEPTVHTYADINVSGNSVSVKGYALTGTDKVVSQGFKYWKNETGEAKGIGAKKATSVPSNAMTIEASGQVMTATFTGLEYSSTYSYLAFVTTSEGETFYGEEQTFTTEDDPTGIEEIPAEPAEQKPVTIVAQYNMSGMPISSPQKGINILRMSDGTVQKVLVK